MMNVVESQAADNTSGGISGPGPHIPKNCLALLPHPLPRAAELLFASEPEAKLYWDRSHYDSPESQMKALAKSSSLYIGNLAFSTRSSHLRSHFSQIGPVKAVNVGLDRFRKSPCGFCFVEYVHRTDALLAVANLSGTKLDGRVIRVELDAGFQPGRQYGRGASGGQVRDDRRATSDPARSTRGNKNKLNWTPPDQVRAAEEKDTTPTDSYYGAGEKRDRDGAEGGGDADMDRPEKNPRFREE
jgi:nuclear cap-binding protein subunit 2